MDFFDSIAQAAAEKAAQLQKAAAEVADAAANKSAELQKTATEVADSASKLAGGAADTISSCASQVADAVSETYDSIAKKKDKVLNDIQEFAAIKFYELINSLDYAGSIQKLKDAQVTEKKDLSLLIDFLQKLQKFALEGKSMYLDKTK